jgi:EAL domain-containing protein (putative c-di-GMP-specific phosphodiesterase class I)
VDIAGSLLPAESLARTIPCSQPLTINVNLSCKQFTQPDLLEQIDKILQETELPVGSLKLEITESVVMDNPDLVKALLLELKKETFICALMTSVLATLP